MSLAARTIHNTHNSYNFSVSSCNYKQNEVFCCVMEHWYPASQPIHSSQLMQYHNSDPQSNFIAIAC